MDGGGTVARDAGGSAVDADAGVVLDAGADMDVGGPTDAADGMDASDAPDAEVVMDAGAPDSGAPDSGAPFDAGPTVSFEGREWVSNGNLQVVTFNNRTALQLTPSTPTEEVIAFAPFEPMLQDGVIEMDIASPHNAATNNYLGVAFRMQGSSFENVYFRPHLSGTPNAIQYEPTYSQNDINVFLRHRDPEFQQSTTLPANDWFHVRIVVSGLNMQVYVDNEAVPSMARRPLLGINQSGLVGLKLYGGIQRTALFSNITFTPATSSSTRWSAFQDGVLPTATYNGTDDVWIDSTNPTTNNGSTGVVAAGGQPDGSALFRWDTTSIPSGRQVSGAWVVLDCAATTNATFPLFGLNRPWNEAAADWLQFDQGSLWATAGAQGTADRGATAIGVYANPIVAEDGTLTTGTRTIELDAQGIALVQSWIDDPASNRGLIVQDYGATSAVGLSASEAGDVARRPKLIVEYTD